MKIIRSSVSFMFVLVCLMACNNQFNAEEAGKLYCECMRDNDAVTNFDKASEICDKELIEKNRYFKLWAIDMRNRELDTEIVKETRDSVKLFISSFTHYTNTNCCKETLWCP